MIHILTTLTRFKPIITVISEKMIHSVIMSITEIQIIFTSTRTVQTTIKSKILIQRKLLIMSIYVRTSNSVKVLISFKNMMNL